jgi:hypothetical protein
MRLENKVALATGAGRTPGETMVKVWDRFVRVSHWAVALGFFVAYLT